MRRRQAIVDPLKSAIVEDASKARNHKAITTGIVGRGPKWYDGTESPSPPPCNPGDRVDVLLNDGRIMRTTVAHSPYCGGVWLDGVHGHVRVTRVRAPGDWASVNHVKYDLEVK